MSMLNCNCRGYCTTAALVVSAVIGVLAAFFQITGIITVTTVFLWVSLGVAVGYLGVLLFSVPEGRTGEGGCLCRGLNLLLLAILGTILLALVLLAVGIVATSVLSAVLVGLLLFFFTLTFAAAACFIRCLANCES